MYKNETRYALINGVVLNGTRDMTPQTGKIVCVEGSRIAAVADARRVRAGGSGGTVCAAGAHQHARPPAGLR